MIIEILRKINSQVLGVNRRNQEYVRPLNLPSSKRIADNKLLTKRIISSVGINTPTLYKVIRTKKQLQFLDWESLPKSFVIKPNQGTGGNGILVFFGKRKNKLEWIRPNGTYMSKNDIILHIENILEGRYSMGNRIDIALIEERVKNDNSIKPYTYKGVPDVRVIVYNRVPIMAMLRLPTKRSNGTANLHSGAICCGIDIASGVTMSGMYLKPNPIVEDTYNFTDYTLDLERNVPITGIQIPYWNKILEIAIKCQDVSGLGYLGVDIALDREKGPVIFEINARPGLGIQVANREGLRERLKRVEGLSIKSIKHGISVSKNLFGGQVEKEIETVSGKTVVNLIEKINVFHKIKTRIKRKRTKTVKNKREVVNALLDTGTITSRIDWGLAATIGYYDALNYFISCNIPKSFSSFIDAQEYIDKNTEVITKHPDIIRLAKISEDGKVHVRPVIEVDIKIAKEIKKIEMVIGNRTDMLYPVLIGRKDLKDYLIDPSKTFNK
mgnify:CR=1 FL=1